MLTLRKGPARMSDTFPWLFRTRSLCVILFRRKNRLNCNTDSSILLILYQCGTNNSKLKLATTMYDISS